MRRERMSRRPALRPSRVGSGRRSLRTADVRLARREARRFERLVAESARVPKAGRSIGARLLSLGALAAAGALLVATSVPASLFFSPSNAQATITDVPLVVGQSMHVSGEAAGAAPVRDAFDVSSRVQVLALTNAAPDYTYTATTGAVRWPFPYSVPINDGFGPRSDGFHKGIDMMAAGDTPVYAIADGIATTSRIDGSGYGQHVVLEHDLGGVEVESLYSHFREGSSPIEEGQAVKAGDFLRLVGDTGYATVEHLHFEIHVDGSPIDPFSWMQANATN